MVRLNASNAQDTVTLQQISSTDTTVTVQDSSKFSQTPFYAVLQDKMSIEIIEVTAVNGYTWTIKRGQDGTVARSWNSGTLVRLCWTAGMYNDIKNTVNLIDQTTISLDTGSFSVTNLLGTYGSFSVDSDGNGIADGWLSDNLSSYSVQNGIQYIAGIRNGTWRALRRYDALGLVSGNVVFWRAIVSYTYELLLYWNTVLTFYNVTGNKPWPTTIYGAYTYAGGSELRINVARSTQIDSILNEINIDNFIKINLSSMGELPSNIKSYFNNSVTYWSDLGTTNYISNLYGTSKRGIDWLNELIPYGENTFTVYYKLYKDRIVSSVVNEPIRLGVSNTGFMQIHGSTLKLQNIVTLPGISQAIRSVNSNTDLSTVNESVVFANASAGAITITLPKAVNNTGRNLTIKKIDSSTNAVTIVAQSGETIEGQSQSTLASQYANVTLFAYGTTWYKL